MMRLLSKMYFFLIWLNHGTIVRICNTVYIIISFSQPRLKWETGNQREVKARAVPTDCSGSDHRFSHLKTMTPSKRHAL